MKSKRTVVVNRRHLLHHITLATGHTMLHRLDTIDPGAVAACRTLVPFGGPVPGLPKFRVHYSGDRVFTICYGRFPIITCGIGEGEDDTWRALKELQETCCPVTVTPPTTRWMAVALLPSLGLLERADLLWLGDFERCMAAAMVIEADRSERAHRDVAAD